MNISWFKFDPGQWLGGKISHSIDLKSDRYDYLVLCCKYWQKECEMTKDEALEWVDEDVLIRLMNRKIIVITSDNIHIKFLDEQIKDIKNRSETNAKNGRKGGQARAKRPLAKRLPNAKQTPSEIKQIDREIDKAPKSLSYNSNLSTSNESGSVGTSKILLGDFLTDIPSGGPNQKQNENWWSENWNNLDSEFINFAISRKSGNYDGIQDYTRQCRTVWRLLSSDDKLKYSSEAQKQV